MSQRQLTRLFVRHLGRTPARYVRRARTEAAAHLLASTDHPVTTVARECGLRSAEALRQAFAAEYGLAPLAVPGRAPACRAPRPPGGTGPGAAGLRGAQERLPT